MSKKTNKVSENFLNKVPVVSGRHSFTVDNSGIVTFHVKHEGFFDKVAQKLFGRPQVTDVSLEEKGSYVFLLIDGKRTVYDIMQLTDEKFGDGGGVISYMQMLGRAEFIEI